MLRRCVQWNDLVAIAASADDDETRDLVTNIIIGITEMKHTERMNRDAKVYRDMRYA